MALKHYPGKASVKVNLVNHSYRRYGFAAGEGGAGGFRCFRRSAAWPHRRSGCNFTAGIKREINMRVISSAAAVVLLAGLNSQASAQTPEQFYAGKNIDFVIGYPTGGANDVWARVI